MQTYHSDTLDMQVTIPESDAGEAVPTYRPGDGVTILPSVLPRNEFERLASRRRTL